MKSDNLERYFRALANKRRLKLIVYLNKNGELELNKIVQDKKLPYKTVFRNLSILRTAGFLESRIYKSKVYFRLNNKQNPAIESLLDLVKNFR